MFAACGGGSNQSSSAAIDASTLAGYWEEVDIAEVYVFNAGGTGQQELFGTTFDFTWKLNGSKLVFDFGDGVTEEYTLSMKGSNLIMNDGTIDFEYKKK